MMPQSVVASVPASDVLLFLRNLHVSLLPWNSHHPLRPIFFCWAYVYHQHDGDEVDSIRRNAHRFHRHRISTIKDREPLGTKPTGPRQSSWGRSFAVSFSSSRRPIISIHLLLGRCVMQVVAFPGSRGGNTKKLASELACHRTAAPHRRFCWLLLLLLRGKVTMTVPLWDAAARWFVAIGISRVL